VRTVPIFDLDLHLVHRPLWTKALPSVSQSFTSCEERPGAAPRRFVRRASSQGDNQRTSPQSPLNYAKPHCHSRPRRCWPAWHRPSRRSCSP
jgi:hypothetical protein